ncbi:hypothetical protein BDV95DRAFT_493631 [Massariosphaeria phaeospora]|uniref:Uncharacterized protein n=1 Tax=Massariosphaeria phaeospora TaxID=100035 RepID=A0A7C8MAC2_9PLEO|nr:hypothetical protein BDV95DRAFT_493631 [Massariosphaeria phaeospora]
MSSILSSLNDLAQSVVELVWSLFTTAGSLVQRTISFVLSFISGCANVVVDFFKGLVDLTGGVVQFFISNILILGAIAVAFFGFLQYQRQQGKQVKVGNTKLN